MVEENAEGMVKTQTEVMTLRNKNQASQRRLSQGFKGSDVQSLDLQDNHNGADVTSPETLDPTSKNGSSAP